MRLARAAILLALLAACGGDDPTGPGGNTLANGSFSARVDGSAFNAASATVIVTGNITSIGAGNASGHSLGFAWVDTGTGTYTLGPASAANALYTQSGAGWAAGTGTGSGTITITTRTATRVAGTFSFVLAASSGTASGTRTVSQGSFDLTF